MGPRANFIDEVPHGGPDEGSHCGPEGAPYESWIWIQPNGGPVWTVRRRGELFHSAWSDGSQPTTVEAGRVGQREIITDSWSIISDYPTKTLPLTIRSGGQTTKLDSDRVPLEWREYFYGVGYEGQMWSLVGGGWLVHHASRGVENPMYSCDMTQCLASATRMDSVEFKPMVHIYIQLTRGTFAYIRSPVSGSTRAPIYLAHEDGLNESSTCSVVVTNKAYVVQYQQQVRHLSADPLYKVELNGDVGTITSKTMRDDKYYLEEDAPRDAKWYAVVSSHIRTPVEPLKPTALACFISILLWLIPVVLFASVAAGVVLLACV